MKVAKAEMHRRRRIVVALISSGFTKTQVIESAMQPRGEQPGLAKGAARRMYDRVMAEWSGALETQLSTARAEAIQRVRRDLAELRNPGQLRNANGYPVFENVLDKDGRPMKRGGRNLKRPVKAPIDFARIAAHEALLAKLEGSFAPIEVRVDQNVTVRNAVLAIVAKLTPEMQEKYVAEDEERERLADEARRSRKLNGHGPRLDG